MSDAEAVLAGIKARIEHRGRLEAGAFEVRRTWIETDDGEAVVKVVFRQRGEAWTGFAKRDLLPWVYQDRMLTPAEVADDIYDFVLVEPTETPTWLAPDVEGVHWWPESHRPVDGTF